MLEAVFFIETHLGFGGFSGRGAGSSIGFGGRGGFGGSSIGLGGLPGLGGSSIGLWGLSGGFCGSSPGLGGAGICNLYGKDKSVEYGCIILTLDLLTRHGPTNCACCIPVMSNSLCDMSGTNGKDSPVELDSGDNSLRKGCY